MFVYNKLTFKLFSYSMPITYKNQKRYRFEMYLKFKPTSFYLETYFIWKGILAEGCACILEYN